MGVRVPLLAPKLYSIIKLIKPYNKKFSIHVFFLFIILLPLILFYCKKQESKSQIKFHNNTDIIAKIDNNTVVKSDVDFVIKETGISPKIALDKLIETELLSQYAKKIGLKVSRFNDIIKKQSIQRYLTNNFESKITPQSISEEELRASYQKNISMFVHPQLYKVVHILVDLPAETATKEKKQQAYKIAQNIWMDAKNIISLDEFGELAEQYKVNSPFQIRYEKLPLFSKDDLFLDQDFIKAAAKLTESNKLSDIVETKFGYHVIYLLEIIKAKNEPFDKVIDQVRNNEFPFYQKQKFNEFIENLMSKYDIKINLELLEKNIAQ